MAKIKSVYVCAECGYETNKWMGKCPECGKWNTFSEENRQSAVVEEKKLKRAPGTGAPALEINDIPDEASSRITTGIGEMDRVLGGGIVEGSMVLVGG
ncbi:MAG: DNA repair protein RadA, partial [Clostridia bacterium]|nr:DNA repair protein RadA [Clostridia bacterium]